MTKQTEKTETTTEVLIEEVNSTGLIRISEDVIISVVKHYTLTVPGVISFAQSGFASGLADLLTRKPAESSVTLEMEGDYVNISVALIVRFGVSVPEIAAEVQSVISSKVEELTGKAVNKVDVTIRDLAMDPEKDESCSMLEGDLA
jgi:uncharacterized alkaline shock family protein YloU